MMYLYRFLLETTEGKHMIVALAENEEDAFEAAEQELQVHFVKSPVIKELTLHEKRKILRGSAAIVSDKLR